MLSRRMCLSATAGLSCFSEMCILNCQPNGNYMYTDCSVYVYQANIYIYASCTYRPTCSFGWQFSINISDKKKQKNANDREVNELYVCDEVKHKNISDCDLSTYSCCNIFFYMLSMLLPNASGSDWPVYAKKNFDGWIAPIHNGNFSIILSEMRM